MQQYLSLMRHIIANGVQKNDRTQTGTLSIFGYQMRFDLSQGFPLVTTKKVHLKSIIHELLWFLRGESNVKSLQEVGVTIWDEWADAKGELGPVYGKQWRSWPISSSIAASSGALSATEATLSTPRHSAQSIDQISELIERLKKDPDSRRLIVCSWNVAEINNMALPPCHCLFQFYVANGRLSCQLYQRSADVFLGVPFNIASYALLTQMVAAVVGLEVGEFIHTLGDAHLYLNHLEQAKMQLAREPYPLPRMELKSDVKSIFDFQYEDFTLINYQSHPRIAAPIAV